MVRTTGRVFFGVMVVLLMARCGVPREAGRLAASEAALTGRIPADDAGIRARLIEQEAAWSKMAALLRENEVGGIVMVDQDFVEIAGQVAALAKRQRELIEKGEDDPVLNRQTLERFEGLWKSADAYLKQ